MYRTVTAPEETDLLPRQREVLDAVLSLGEASAEEIRQRLHRSPGVRIVQQLRMRNLAEDRELS